MHVLSFSAFHMLRSISDILKPGDIDAALDDLLSIYQEELFGSVAEEKKVVAITEKIFEAKTIKGYNAYKIIAENISSDLLGSLICPLKKVDLFFNELDLLLYLMIFYVFHYCIVSVCNITLHFIINYFAIMHFHFLMFYNIFVRFFYAME